MHLIHTASYPIVDPQPAAWIPAQPVLGRTVAAFRESLGHELLLVVRVMAATGKSKVSSTTLCAFGLN